jgi:flagella basal body P-ring formation protein FlgA
MNNAPSLLSQLFEHLVTRALWVGVAVCWFSAPAFAVNPPSKTASNASPLEALQSSVKHWVALKNQVAAEQVQLAPLDSRVKLRACERPLAMDLPFANAQTVRVRCSQPVWQQFVQVSVSGKPAQSLAGAPSWPADKGPSANKPAEPTQRWVLVASVPLQRGMTLNATHVQRAQVDTQGMPVNVLEQASEVLHAEVVRDVRPGVPLRSQDIRPTVLVKRGQMVLLSVGQPQGFQISARVEALQDGRYGEQIKLKNRDSGRELSGRVQGPNQVVGL